MKPKFFAPLLFLSLCTVLAWAKEGGDQYPNGAEKWMLGALPPAGSYYINYFGFYSGKLKNSTGDKALLAGATPTVDATFDAFRFVQVTRLRLFGASYGMHAIVPVVHQSINLNGSASATGVGDITLDPFVFGWHRPSWHAIAGLDVNIPSGKYDQNDSRVSIGANYASFEPVLALSYMPKSGWEASSKLMYNWKTTNPDTNYHSGQEFHVDYAAGRHFGKWMAGVTGYGLKQTTDDKAGSVVAPAVSGLWDAGRRGQVFSIGPSVGFTNSRHMIFMADWQHETAVRNRFGGDKFWFKAILPLDGLFAHHAGH